MRSSFLFGAVLLGACSGASEESIKDQSSLNEEKMWVTSQYLDRHTCPSKDCGVVGRLMFREGTNVFETQGEWVRITENYNAMCVGGVSEFVDSGNAQCVPQNGITDEQFAEWVLASSLSKDRPADPAETAAQNERIVAQSDDFAQHREAFVKAANQLISDGRCTAVEIEEMGGWAKSSNERNRPIYFTYCGGMTIANRLYLDVETGRIYQ